MTGSKWMTRSKHVPAILTYLRRNYGLHLVMLKMEGVSIALANLLTYNHFLGLVVATNIQPDILFGGENQLLTHEVLDYHIYFLILDPTSHLLHGHY